LKPDPNIKGMHQTLTTIPKQGGRSGRRPTRDGEKPHREMAPKKLENAAKPGYIEEIKNERKEGRAWSRKHLTRPKPSTSCRHQAPKPNRHESVEAREKSNELAIA
jgi:hypothetical protein